MLQCCHTVVRGTDSVVSVKFVASHFSEIQRHLESFIFHFEHFRSVESNPTGCQMIELETIYKLTFGCQTIRRNVGAENAVLVRLAAAVHQRHLHRTLITCNGV